jgi:hypothetical protein
MICHAFNKLLSKNKSFCIFCLLICHAIYVTFTTDIKIIGQRV